MQKRFAGLLAGSLLQGIVSADTASPPHPATLTFTGYATDPADGELLYREQHRLEGQCTAAGFVPVRGVVRYLAPNGQPLGDKHLDYRNSITLPDYRFHYPSLNYSESVEIWSDGFRTQSQRGEKLVASRFSRADFSRTPVTDAGFDQFVRLHWPRLREGETLGFDYLSAPKAMIVGLRLVPDSTLGTGIVIRLEPSNPLFRWLSAPIQLRYDNWGNLLEYRGITNMPQASGGNVDALISYEYDQSATDLCSRGQASHAGLN